MCRALAGHEELSYAVRTITRAQRGQIVQRVIVDGWTSAEAAAAFGVPEAACRRSGSPISAGMAWRVFARIPARTIAAEMVQLAVCAADAGDVAQDLDRAAPVLSCRAARPALAAAPLRTRTARASSRHRLRKAGLRFSMKASMPSFWSSVAKVEWNSRRSKRTPSARVVSIGAVDRFLDHHRDRPRHRRRSARRF